MANPSALRSRSIALIAVAVVLAACSSSGVRVHESSGSTDNTDTTESLPDDSAFPLIEWGSCADDDTYAPADEDATLECAMLTVPLDYEHEDGDTIDIALVRAPATADREGAVVFNPGGPGASGFDPIAYSGSYLQEQLGLEHFDIIGFDPRGVDRSGAIECVDDAFRDAHLYIDDTPETPEEQALVDEDENGFIDACVAKYGDTLRHYSTANTARDIDRIRAGLRDPKISYLGISYGTYLGGIYATLFPERVRAMVLDSAYDPAGDTIEQQLLTQIVGFENAFDDWAAWCEGDDTCAFHADDVGARWDALRATLDATSIPNDEGRRINNATMEVATSASLYSRSDWPVLADALARAERGDGSGILTLADAYVGRNADGTFTSLFQSIGIISCASGIVSMPPADPQALLDELKAKAPRFGGDTTLDDFDTGEYDDLDGCSALTGSAELLAVSYTGDAPVVVVGGENDPATPIRWAEELAAAMGDSAQLVRFTGEGHGQLLASTCITEIEGAVLADGTLPDDGTVCDPDPVVERPDWWDDIELPDSVSGVVSLPALMSVLGIDETIGYGESHTTTLAPDVASMAVDGTLIGAGFEFADTVDVGIDGLIDRMYVAPNGDMLVVLTIGPDALASEELGEAAGSVPADTTVVVLVYIPN